LFLKEIRPDYCTPQSGVQLTSSCAVTADRLKLPAANAASRRARGSMSAVAHYLFVNPFTQKCRGSSSLSGCCVNY